MRTKRTWKSHTGPGQPRPITELGQNLWSGRNENGDARVYGMAFQSGLVTTSKGYAQ